jgi:hypothetical protein
MCRRGNTNFTDIHELQIHSEIQSHSEMSLPVRESAQNEKGGNAHRDGEQQDLLTCDCGD